jgi:hypothetical protein
MILSTKSGEGFLQDEILFLNILEFDSVDGFGFTAVFFAED